MADPTRSTQEQAKPGQGSESSAARQAREYSSDYERQAWQSGQSGQAGQAGQAAKKRVSEVAGQARETINQAYSRASRGMSDTWEQAMDFSKEHPGAATIVAFGAGVGLGILLAGSLGGFQSRSRTRRMVPPVMDAISMITREFLR
jgi:ElaB/YqjD/DUF883 family membrane-anchored ribosome-binding protein